MYYVSSYYRVRYCLLTTTWDITYIFYWITLHTRLSLYILLYALVVKNWILPLFFEKNFHQKFLKHNVFFINLQNIGTKWLFCWKNYGKFWGGFNKIFVFCRLSLPRFHVEWLQSRSRGEEIFRKQRYATVSISVKSEEILSTFSENWIICLQILFDLFLQSLK